MATKSRFERNWHNTLHFVHWCRYGETPQEARMRQVNTTPKIIIKKKILEHITVFILRNVYLNQCFSEPVDLFSCFDEVLLWFWNFYQFLQIVITFFFKYFRFSVTHYEYTIKNVLCLT